MTTLTRPSVIDTMFEHAMTAAKRSTCPAKHVGAVIARGDVIVAVGVNGAPRGLPHCDDVGCVVIPGNGTRDSTRASDHREYSRHVHAEANAILHCARDGRSTEGCDLYVIAFPCPNCALLIIQAGIRRVFVPTDGLQMDSAVFDAALGLLRAANVEMHIGDGDVEVGEER